MYVFTDRSQRFTKPTSHATGPCQNIDIFRVL